MATLADALRGYTPPTTSALGDPIVEHFRTLPQQLATNQAALDKAIGSWNKTDFGTGQPNPNYRPEAIAELTQLIPNVGGLTAWHGTPHKIQGAFDISKVGTGEGAQAYGHGMYFAESPNIAKHYQNTLGKWVDRIKLGDAELPVNEAITKYANDGAGMAKALEKMKNNGTLTISQYNDMIKDVIIPEIRTNAKIPQEKWGDVEGLSGNLYKVDIPDEHIPNMLDWDKPLTQNAPQQVKDALNGIIKEYPDLKEPFMKAFRENKPGNHYYSLLNDYAKTGDLVKNQQFASDVLQKAGIPGIRYLDQSSRGTGKGTSNFVVFDPSTVKILEENSKPVSRKALLEEQINKLD